ADDPLGIQGAWYAYGDQITCVAPEGNPCTADGCCLPWTTIVDSTYESWGCGLGLELYSTGGDAPVRRAYSGAARGFTITITGSSRPNPIRVAYTQRFDLEGVVSPFIELDGPGTYSVLFSDVICPSWALEKGCDPDPAATTRPYDLQVQIPGGDAAGAGQICIVSLSPF
ncbi:MAG TPA: hypothetical protein PLU22_22150, partial [Polyangiaceae bacterium]|nr:hypothetical protein [Polyangiaceae bacterium]